jgi:hypothetical protein
LQRLEGADFQETDPPELFTPPGFGA